MTETIGIVLPAHDAEVRSVERSLSSLVTQSGDFRLRIHVQHSAEQENPLSTLLREWQSSVDRLDTGLQCRDVRLSVETGPSKGIYATVHDTLDQVASRADCFIGWLRPGDVLLPGALAHIADLARCFEPAQLSWVQGAHGHMIGEKLIAGVTQKCPAQLLASGLADGVHWPMLPQGGIFFRAWLWHRACCSPGSEGDSLLEEWRLWRSFGQHARLVQMPQPIGIFAHVQENLPAHRRILMRRRMDRQYPVDERREECERIFSQGALLRYLIRGPFQDGPLQVTADDVSRAVHDWARPRGLWPEHREAPEKLPARVVAEGRRRLGSGQPHAPHAEVLPHADSRIFRSLCTEVSTTADVRAENWRRLGPVADWHVPARRRHPMWQATRIRVWDQDWDPVENTEWAAFRAVRHIGDVPRGTAYAGFPWSALIDAMDHDTPERARLASDFGIFCQIVAGEGKQITTCQHPNLMAHLGLLNRAGITDVFWPHVTPANVQSAALERVHLHPISHVTDVPMARAAPQVTRLHLLAGPESSGSDLCKSRFALCPGGTGGHSARLWQVIAAGAVPVIEQPAPGRALPGPVDLWLRAVIFTDAPLISRRDLCDRLAERAEDPVAMKRHHEAMSQLWLGYGPEALAHGIHALMCRHADRAHGRSGLAEPATISRRLRIYHLGPRAARTPLAYEPLSRLAETRVTRAEIPEEADLVLTGWNRDLAEKPELLAHAFSRNPGLRCMVLSEEPLWDTVWSGGFKARDRPFESAGRTRVYRYLNHVNSDIFKFEQIPYFLLTAEHFVPRYLTLLEEFLRMRPRSLLQRWRSAPISVAFVAEYRDDPAFDIADDELDIKGLSGYRTRVAKSVTDSETRRTGIGWPGTDTRRQMLPDWHLEKLARLNGRARICSAYENTHLNGYISEKPFDALALGAVPVCYAGPAHRLHEFLSPASMINTYAETPERAAVRIDRFSPGLSHAEAWLEDVTRLRARLTRADDLAAERRRIITATLHEIEDFMQSSQ